MIAWKLVSCLVIEATLVVMKIYQLFWIGFFQLENVPFGIIVESRSSDSWAINDFL